MIKPHHNQFGWYIFHNGQYLNTNGEWRSTASNGYFKSKAAAMAALGKAKK